MAAARHRAGAPHLVDQRALLEQRLVRVQEAQDGAERRRGGVFDAQQPVGGPIHSGARAPPSSVLICDAGRPPLPLWRCALALVRRRSIAVRAVAFAKRRAEHRGEVLGPRAQDAPVRADQLPLDAERHVRVLARREHPEQVRRDGRNHPTRRRSDGSRRHEARIDLAHAAVSAVCDDDVLRR
jgi:hypothetical protein